MENILRDTEGILDASVNYAEGTVYVKYDPQVLDRKQVFFAVRKLGYKVNIISEITRKMQMILTHIVH